MKKLVLVATLALVIAPLGASADHGPGASVDKEGGCFMSEAAHDVSGLGIITTPESHSVLTPSGNWKLTCHFEFDPALAPAKAVKNGGFTCGIENNGHFTFTTDTRSVVSAGGTATLQCMVKA